MNQRIQAWDHQPPAVEYLISNKNSVLNASMGCGKSKILVDTLRVKSTIGTKKTLILCPAAVRGVWRGQFMAHAPGEFDVVICDAKSTKDNAQKIIQGMNRRQTGGLPLVVVINYESFWRPNIFSLLTSSMWEVMACDEIHRIKGYAATCSKQAWHLGKRAGSRTGLTGTLMPNSPLDVFGQYRFLQEEIFGRYITHFRARYAVLNPKIPQKVDEWINQEEMTEKVNLIRYQISKDVLVLPDRQNITIEVPLSPAGMNVYKQMKKDAIAIIRQKIHDSDEEMVRTVFATNGAVQFLRLLQLAQGYSKDEDGHEFDTDTEKRKVLLSLLEDAGEPVAVYGWFKHDMQCVEDCCRILGLRYGEVSGRRKDLTEHSKFPEDIDVMGVQAKSGSSGIDLTRARIGIVMNSGMLSPGDYEQMESRQYRPGQTRNVVWYTLASPGTIDFTIARARADKKDVIDAILDSQEFF